VSRAVCLTGAAITAALSCINLRVQGSTTDEREECTAEDIGQHLARTFGRPGLITRAWCDRWLQREAGARAPLNDRQWAAVHAAIAGELAVMVEQEREWAQSQNDEEREMPEVEALVVAAAGRVAA
jgi:hypothetical protein